MQIADADGDGSISYLEFAQAYGTGPWLRAQGVPGLMSQIMKTWKMLDKDDDGTIEVQELVESLIPMVSNTTLQQHRKRRCS